MPRRASLLLGVAWLALAAPLRTAEDPAVALPPFLVEELTKGPPWRYTQAIGYEILARCSDSTTRRQPQEA